MVLELVLQVEETGLSEDSSARKDQVFFRARDAFGTLAPGLKAILDEVRVISFPGKEKTVLLKCSTDKTNKALTSALMALDQIAKVTIIEP